MEDLKSILKDISYKIDLILGSEHVIYNQLKPYNVSLLDVEQLTELPVSNDLKDNYLAFNKAVPQHIVDRFQRAFKVLKQERSLDSFIAPYSNN